MIKFDNIPSELKQIDKWVLWRYEKREGSDKPTKPPYQINGHYASTSDHSTWTTFENVVNTFQSTREFDGIGFVITRDSRRICLDIDECYFDGNSPLTHKLS